MNNKIPQFKLKGCFLCNFCKEICKGPCIDDLERLNNGIVDEQNKDLLNNRKQRIECLGKWCDKPCKYQNKDAVPQVDILVNTIMFLGNKVNELIEENNSLTNKTSNK